MRSGRVSCFLEQRIAVKQLALHINIEAVANTVCGLWQVQDCASCLHFSSLIKINLEKTTCSKR